MDADDVLRKGFLKPEDVRTPEAEKLGRYLLHEEIGRGGSAVVYRAYDPELKRHVALKRPTLLGTAGLRRFLRECEIIARLTHPGIVPVYDVGTEDGLPYFTMPLVEGKTLSEVRLNRGEAVSVIEQVARAVHFAHEHGVIHRDLKPANVIVSRSPTGEWQGFVTDFGIGGTLEPQSKTRLTMTGQVMGTPAYMPPEQATGNWKRVSIRSDVYSLGATLYEALTRRRPFDGETPWEILLKVQRDDPLRPRGIVPDLPRELETVCLRAMDKDPHRRYASAKDFADDLERFRKGEPIRARSTSLGVQMYRTLRRHSLKVALGVTALATLALAILVVKGWQSPSSPTRLPVPGAGADLRELTRLWLKISETRARWREKELDPSETRAHLDSTVKEVGNFIEKNPRLPEGYYLRARGRFYLLDLAGAELDLRGALDLDENYAAAWGFLARVKLRQNWEALFCIRDCPPSEHAGPAEAHLQDAATALSRFRQASQREGSGRTFTPPGTREDGVAEVLIDAYVAVELSNDRESGRRILKEADAQSPSEEYRNQLATWARDRNEALEWQDKAIQIMPHFTQAHLDRGNVLLLAGDYGPAIENYQAVMTVHPKHMPAYLGLGAAHAKRGDEADAIRWYTLAIQEDPHSTHAIESRGVVLYLGGDLLGAKQDMEQAIQLQPRSANPRFDLAHIYYDLGQWKDSREQFAQALDRTTQSDVKAYSRLRLWLVEARLGNRSAATQSLKASLAQGAFTDEWGRNLGHFLVDELSAASLLSVAPSKDQQCEAYFYIGSKHLIDGDAKGAIDFFRRCLGTEISHFTEYRSAAAELKRLGD